MSCSLHIHLPPWPVLRGSHPYPLRKHCPPDWKDMLRVSATGGRGFVQLTPLTPLTSLVSQGSVWNSCLDKERMCPAVTEWGRSQATTWLPSPSKGLTALTAKVSFPLASIPWAWSVGFDVPLTYECAVSPTWDANKAFSQDSEVSQPSRPRWDSVVLYIQQKKI